MITVASRNTQSGSRMNASTPNSTNTEVERGLILAGGAAGIAAAFNTPIAGAIFCIEEIARSFDRRNMPAILRTVAIACIVGAGSNQPGIFVMDLERAGPEDYDLLAQAVGEVDLKADRQVADRADSLRVELEAEDPRVEWLLLEARCLAVMERTLEARNVYTRLSQEDPTNVNVWIELGTVAWELEDYHRVAQCSARATV